jgi:hypothetical protein
MRKEIKRIFDSNSKLDEVFETSDGNAFYLESDAKNHVKTLKNGRVVKHLRPEEVAEVQEAKVTGEFENTLKGIIKNAIEANETQKQEIVKVDKAPVTEEKEVTLKIDKVLTPEATQELIKVAETLAPEATQEPVKTNETPVVEKAENTLFEPLATEEKKEVSKNKTSNK